MKTSSRCVDYNGNAVVYIARDKGINGLYKIGCSKDPNKRLNTIGSGDCEIVYKSHPDYCNGTEVYVHSLLNEKRRIWKGSGKTEWFELSQQELNFVKLVIENHSKYILICRKNQDLNKKLHGFAEIIKEMSRLIPKKYLDKFVKKIGET